jgi:hypothetical protein
MDLNVTMDLAVDRREMELEYIRDYQGVVG